MWTVEYLDIRVKAELDGQPGDIRSRFERIVRLIRTKMTRKFIPVEESFAEWRKDPEYMKEYEALEEEFALAEALIEARSTADLTQEQVAERMHTSQSYVAKLEGGRINPTLKALKRYAEATGTKLRFSFVRDQAR